MIERKRKLIEDSLQRKFKALVDVQWYDGFYGNQIIELNIHPYDFIINVEIDRMMFLDNTTSANVDCILYWVRRQILGYILCD